jgi:hypothetical protein
MVGDASNVVGGRTSKSITCNTARSRVMMPNRICSRYVLIVTPDITVFRWCAT